MGSSWNEYRRWAHLTYCVDLNLLRFPQNRATSAVCLIKEISQKGRRLIGLKALVTCLLPHTMPDSWEPGQTVHWQGQLHWTPGSRTSTGKLLPLHAPTQRARRGISMPRGKNCRETIFAAQLPRNCPHPGGNFERGKIALSCGGEAVSEAFWEAICVRVIASQKLPRDWGGNFCHEASRCLTGPSGHCTADCIGTAVWEGLSGSGKGRFAGFPHGVRALRWAKSRDPNRESLAI